MGIKSGCSRLKGCLRDLPHDAAQTGQVERWPAAAALGYAVHRQLVGTRGDEDDSFFGLPMHEQREVMELLNMVDVEGDGDYGGLTNTL